MNIKFLLTLFLTFSLTHAFAVDYYVSAITGSDSNNGLTTTTAFCTIQKAADKTSPGDIVYIMEGTYSEAKVLFSIHATVLYISRSGTSNAYITYKNYPGHKPKISGVNCRWNCVRIRANYIRFEGIELEGPNQNITYEEARAMYDYYVTTPPASRDWHFIGTMNTNGLSLGGDMISSVPWHHIEVRNCVVHDFQGGGIGGSDFDYITIENNVVYNNSWHGMYATSGISVFHSRDFDSNTSSYKNFVRGNICYNNKTLIPWAGRDILSDGNGIIIDDNKNSQVTGGTPYAGKTLVENNVSYNNGGSGIHAYSSNNVDIINNTAYNNGTVVGYPEIYGQDGVNVNIYNNIMYARTGGACNSNAGGTTYDYNIYFNGPASRQGANDVVADPKFVKLAFDETSDFKLRNSSPAINSGTDAADKFSPVDINGVARPVGAKPDRGAYESPFTEIAVVAEMAVKQGSAALANGSGNYAFGDVFYNGPKTVSFTIENKGGATLQLTGTPRVAVSGTGFFLAEDAPATINTGGSVTFKVTLTTNTEIQYLGTISIANNDAYENPYVISLTGKGLSDAKALQTITFNALPVKTLQDTDFSPEATASSGLPVTYTSSKSGVATIVDGKIHIVGLGTTIITASQAGDASTHPATHVSQSLTVIPEMNLSTTNLVSNPNFNSGTTGWSFAYQNAGSASTASVAKTGYSSNVGKVTIASLGTTSSAYNVQFGTNVSVVTGKQYAIFFKASADADRMVNLIMLKNVSPWTTMFTLNNVAITTIPTTFGPYYYNSTTTESLAFRFLLGSSNHPIYVDDVEIREVLSLTSSAQTDIGNKKSGFEFYPNPTTDKINIVTSLFQGKQLELTILNLLGQPLVSHNSEIQGSGSDTFPLPINLKSGIYFIELKSGNVREVKTLVVK
jgi:parallel beta-helix repeat protein